MPTRFAVVSPINTFPDHDVQPDYIAPVVGYLTSEDNIETTGKLFEISGGWAAETRWQRAGGHGFPVNLKLTPEDIVSKWDIFTNFGAFVCVVRKRRNN